MFEPIPQDPLAADQSPDATQMIAPTSVDPMPSPLITPQVSPSPAPPIPDTAAPRDTAPIDITLGAPIPNESAAFAAYHALKEERRTPGTVPPDRIPQLRSTLRDYTLTARAYNRPLFAESTQLQRADQARYTQKLLGGLDKLSSALTPEQVKSLDARANLHPDPDAYRARQINRTLLDMAYGKKVKPESYELARNHYAKTVLGSTTPLDDKAFYAALQGRAQKQQNAEKLLGEKLESLLSDTISGKAGDIKSYVTQIKDTMPDLDDSTLENIENELRLKRRQFSELKRTVTPIAQALTAFTMARGDRADAIVNTPGSAPVPQSEFEAAQRFMALTPEQRTMTAAMIAQSLETMPEDQRPAPLRALLGAGRTFYKGVQGVADIIAASYYQTKAEFSEETMRNWTKAAREGDVGTMLLGKASKPEGDNTLQGAAQLRQLSTKAAADMLRPSDGFLAKTGILAATQLPYTIAAASGVGTVLMGASMAGDSYVQARLNQPNADPQKQFAASIVSGAAQAVVERASFKALTGAVKGTGKLTGFLTGKYGTESALRLAGVTNRFARFAAGAGIGATAITATEYGEEIAQEFIDTGLQDLATTMSGMDPDTDYLALLKSWDPRGDKGAKTLMALLPLALIGGAGAGFHHFKHGEILLRNRSALTAVGIAPERIDSITKNPDIAAAQQEFQSAFQEGATQKIEAAEAKRRADAAAAFTEYLEGAQELARAAGYEIIAEDTDFAEMGGEPRFILRLPEQEPQLFATQEEAETALKESIEQQVQQAHDVALESLTGSMVDFLKQEYASGQNVQVSQKDFAGDFDTLIKKGLATREAVQARLELFALERGQSLPQLQADIASGKLDVRIMARAYAKQLTGGATKYFVDLFQGADPIAAAEDFSETHWQHLLTSGLIDAPTALGWLKEAQEKTGYAYLPASLTAATYTPAQRATLIEGLSKASVQYLLGQSTSEQLPEGFRGWIEKMVIAMGQAWTWAKQLLASKKLREAIEENQLPARFVAELADSVGLNDAARMRRAEQEAEAQAMAEFMGDFTPLSTFAKGKLLHPAKAREMDSPFAGELQRIYDHFVSRDRKVKHTKKGVKVDYTERTAAANKFFAPVDEAVNLDDLRQRMTEEGFPNMETISDMLLQIEEVLSIENYEIYATHSSLVAQNAAAGYGPTFSMAGTRAHIPQFMRDSLSAAQDMAAEGKDPETIRSLTGWHPGKYDGKMRWEIPDNRAIIKGEGTAQELVDRYYPIAKQRDAKIPAPELQDILRHPALYDAYPAAKNIAILADANTPYEGTFSPKEPGFTGPVITVKANLKGDALRSTLLHEIQHFIQETEGFARGSSMEEFIEYDMEGLKAKNEEYATAMKSLIKRFENEGKSPADAFSSPQGKIISDSLIKIQDALRAPKQKYKLTAGEIEARDTQARRNLTPEQRKAIAPYSSENIAPESAIVLYAQPATFSMAAISDDRYLELAKDPETNREALQAMVDAAAKAAGYHTKAIHGTAEKFDSFSHKFGGRMTDAASARQAFFLTDDSHTANSYAIYAAEDGPIKDALANADKAEKKGDWDGYDEWIRKAEELDTYDARMKRRENATLIEAYISGDFLEMDAEGKTPQELHDDDMDAGITAQIRQAKREGKTGVVYKNLDDAINLSNRPATHYAVFKPSQIKSAALVTYDKTGNIIPLSQRFNPADDRITFSMAARPLFSSSNVQELRHDKTAWTQAGSNKFGADEIIQKYYKKNAYANIPPDAILVPMPSTKGTNILPDALAAQIAKDFGNPIEKRPVGVATAKNEAKNKRSFFDKEADPVNFVPVPENISSLAGKSVVITEDVHNTGESWIAFANMLIKNKVDVIGVAALTSTEQRMTSPRDIERMAEKISAHTGLSVDAVKESITPLFHETFKQLFNKAEAEVTRSAAAAHKLLAIAQSGNRNGSYKNPLADRYRSESRLLENRPLNQTEFTFSLSALTGSPLHTLLAQKAAAGPTERAEIMEGIRTRLQGLEYKLEARGSGELTEMEKQLLGWRARTDLTPEQRERLRIEDALAQVKAVLAAVPVEIRAKIAVPMARILDAQTDKTTVNAFAELIENLDEELEFHLRGEYTEAISRILDIAQPTMSESRQSKGKLIVETNRLIKAVNEIMELDALNLALEISTTEATIAELERELEGIAEEDAETRAKAQARLDAVQERQHLLYHFGGIGSKDSRELAQSHKILRDIYTRGRVARKILDEERRQWIARMRNDVRNSLDAPRGVSGPAHARATEKKNLTKGYAWNLMNIHNLLQVLFPYSQFAAEASQRLITAQRNVTRARLAAKDRFNNFMDATFGTKNQRERNKIIRQLHKRRNWKAQVSEVNQTRLEKLTIDQAQRILAGTMKPGWETERDTMILLQQAWRDYLAKNKRAREATQFIEITRVVSRKPAVALRLSDMDALYVLQLSRQEEYIPALTTYGYTKEVIEQIREEIDPRALEFMRFYGREYDENWATMNPTFQALYHMDMPRIRNYAPGAFENMKSGPAMSGDPMGDAAPMGAMNFGATKNRRAHRSRPKQYSAHAVYMGHVDRSTYWVEFAEIARDMGMIFRETETRRALEVKHGPEAAAELLTWLDNIANDGAVDAAARLASNTIAQNVAAGQAIAGLSFNFSVPFKQFGAALGSLWYLSPAQALKAFARVIYRPQTFAHVWKSEAIQQRIREGFSPEDRAMLDAAEISPSELYRLHSIARLPITYADAAFTTLSGVIAYDHHYTESRAGGMDHARAHNTAMAFMDRVVFLTAQPVDTQTKSNWEINAKGFAKLLILFKSDPRKQIGLLLADLAKVKDGNLSKAKLAERLLTQWIAYGLMAYIGGAAFRAIAQDDDDDRPVWDWKELLAAMLIGPVEGAGLIGSVIQAAIKLTTGTRNFTNSNNPLADSLTRTVATMKDFDLFSMDTVKLLATITQLGSVKNPLFALIPAAMRGADQISNMMDNINESEEERLTRLAREYSTQQRDAAKAEAKRIDALAESEVPLDQLAEEDRKKVEKKRTTAQEEDTIPPLIQSLKKMSERTRTEKINYILEGLPDEDERASFKALLRTHGIDVPEP